MFWSAAEAYVEIVGAISHRCPPIRTIPTTTPVHTGAILTDAQATVLNQAIALPVDAGRTAPTISASGCHCVDPNHQLARQTDLLRAADMERPATGSPTLMRPAAQPPQLHPHHLLLANTQKVKPAADDTAQSSTKSGYGEVEITFKTVN